MATNTAGMASARAREAARAILTAAEPIQGELRNTQSQWNTVRGQLERLAGGEPMALPECYDVLLAGRAAITDPRGADALRHGHSTSYIREFELIVKAAAAAVCEFVDAAVAELVDVPEQITPLHWHALATRRLVVDPAEADAVAARLLREIDVPARDMAGAPHPLLQMGMTYGAAPLTKALVPEPAGPVLDAELDRATPIRYDLETLMHGVPGTTAAGLNYRLVTLLDTIAPARLEAEPGAARPEATKPEATKPEAVPGEAEVAFSRREGGAYRTMQSRYPLSRMLKGPTLELRQYNELACAAMDVDGYRIPGRLRLLDRIKQSDQEANARVGREMHLLSRLDAEAVGEAGATLVAVSRADAARDAIELQRIDAPAVDVAGEVAITALLDREHLARGFAGAMRHYAPGASGVSVAKTALAAFLAEDEQSVKLRALVNMN